MEFTNADFFAFLGTTVKVLIAAIGLRMLVMIAGVHVKVPIVDPIITMLLNLLKTIKVGLLGAGF